MGAGSEGVEVLVGDLVCYDVWRVLISRTVYNLGKANMNNAADAVRMGIATTLCRAHAPISVHTVNLPYLLPCRLHLVCTRSGRHAYHIGVARIASHTHGSADGKGAKSTAKEEKDLSNPNGHDPERLERTPYISRSLRRTRLESRCKTPAAGT